MRDDEIADLPLWRLSEMVRSREITSTRLTGIYLERITTYDEGLPINSYITVAREAALAQAAEADAVIESGRPRALSTVCPSPSRTISRPRASGPPGGRKSSLPIFPYGTPLCQEAEKSRRRYPRQDQHARVRPGGHHEQPPITAYPQPL